jgi:hypothetical protein
MPQLVTLELHESISLVLCTESRALSAREIAHALNRTLVEPDGSPLRQRYRAPSVNPTLYGNVGSRFLHDKDTGSWELAPAWREQMVERLEELGLVVVDGTVGIEALGRLVQAQTFVGDNWGMHLHLQQLRGSEASCPMPGCDYRGPAGTCPTHERE